MSRYATVTYEKAQDYDLGELSVKPAAVAAYDAARQRMLADHGIRAYRYSGSGLVRTRILTSSTIDGPSANVFTSFAEALEAMLGDRGRAR